MTTTVDPVERESRSDGRQRRRAKVAFVVGVVATLVPACLTGEAYIRRFETWHGWRSYSALAGNPPERYHLIDLIDLLGRDVGWTAVVGTLVALPLWFWLWRRSAMSGARGIGVAAAVATAVGAVGLAMFPANAQVTSGPDGLFWLHVVAGLCYAVAFRLAPPPRLRAS